MGRWIAPIHVGRQDTMGKFKQLIHEFDDLWTETGFDDLVDKLETNRKALLELEIHARDAEDPAKLFRRMERFRLRAARLGYWVEFKDEGSVPGAYDMFASRIRSVVEAPMTLYRTDDRVAGLMGVLYGYPLPKILEYCRRTNSEELLEGARKTEQVRELREMIRFLEASEREEEPRRPSR